MLASSTSGNFWARSWCLPLAAAFAALSSTVAASATLKSVGTAEIDVHLPGGTAGLTIDGKSSELVAKESGGVITVTAKLDCVTENRGHTCCIKTGIAMRGKHLWKYLEAGTFHEATLTVERNKLNGPGDHETIEGDATGIFSLHGVQRPLNFHYTSQRTGSDIQVHGQITVNLKDFNIEQPSFGGVQTGMVAEIEVQFTLRDG